MEELTRSCCEEMEELTRSCCEEIDTNGNNGLHRTADIGNADMFTLYVRYASQDVLNHKNNKGQTPLMMAINGRNRRYTYIIGEPSQSYENSDTDIARIVIVKYLLMKNVDLQCRDQYGKNALDYAEGHEIIQELLRAKMINPAE